METLISNNWKIGSTPEVLDEIYHSDINIVIHERDLHALKTEIETLVQQDIEVRASGDVETVLTTLKQVLNPQKYTLILQDIEGLLHSFQRISHATSLQVLLATVTTDMCRRFHADLNYLRMLCTYHGEGTLWLTEDNVLRKPLDAYGNTSCTVIDEAQIQQAQTGAVVILKGELYAKKNVPAIAHRSPAIEEGESKRLLLRIDTHEFLNTSS